MASPGDVSWTWDSVRQDWYYVTRDAYGNYAYHYQKDQQQQATTGYGAYGATPSPETTGWAVSTASTVAGHSRNDSVVQPEMIRGTPEAGLYEGLDPSYRMRTGAEIYQFFRIGKVFSMLHIQAASANIVRQRTNDTTISLVQYGEHAFSQIRRFIIVDVRRGFVYACPITTYSERGCLKQGCAASEHCVVYVQGTNPAYLQGEYESGLTKPPICIIPADPSISMRPASRLHYAKVYPVEMNVKVKDIGDVVPEALGDLVRFYREEGGPQ